MKIKGLCRILMMMLIVGSNVGCDRISKHIVRTHVGYRDEIALIENHVTLTKIENSGAFLSTGASWSDPLKTVVLIIIPVLALAFGVLYAFVNRTLSNAGLAAICFIVGGGMGNLYDRIVHGSVTDFLHIDFVFFQTGIFNLADVSIMSGIVLLTAELFLTRGQRHTPGIKP